MADASQLHQPTAGVQIPGLNAWLIIAVITAVWAILFLVALRTAAIAGAGVETGPGRPPPGASGAPQPPEGRPGQQRELPS